MVTVSSPLDPIVNYVISALSFLWTYLEKKKSQNCSEWSGGTQLQVILFLKGSKKHLVLYIYVWFVFCKVKCLPTNLFTVLHKKSITSLAFGWNKINSKTCKYHFSPFRRNFNVPVLFSGSSLENTVKKRKLHIFSMETPGGFVEIRDTLKTEEKMGNRVWAHKVTQDLTKNAFFPRFNRLYISSLTFVISLCFIQIVSMLYLSMHLFSTKQFEPHRVSLFKAWFRSKPSLVKHFFCNNN